VIVSIRGVADTVTLHVAGELDMANAGDLEHAMTTAMTTSPSDGVIVDFTDVTFCDSSGIAALDRAYFMATQHRIAFRLINVQPPVRRVLEIVGIADRLTQPSP
jgi:anti-sigma B factor antagonist